MRRDGPRLLRRATRKHLANRFRHSHGEDLILFIAINLGAFAPDTALFSIGRAFCLGLFERRFFNQHSLAFVSLASPAKANHHGRERAVLPGTSG